MDTRGEEGSRVPSAEGFLVLRSGERKNRLQKPRKNEVWYWYVKAHKKNVTMLLTIPVFAVLTESLL